MGKTVIGWDIGGAHLKATRVEDGSVTDVRQTQLPLWLGMKHLRKAFRDLNDAVGSADRHAVTMTGELVDLFSSRREGVDALVTEARRSLTGDVAIYAGRAGFCRPEDAALHHDDIASANWHATANFLARTVGEAILVDMGSTTTDIIPLTGGKVASRGYTDAERLTTGELLYTGAVRTPLMALADKIPFKGHWYGVTAEYFATMADVNRLLGRLDESADLYPPADGKGKSNAESIVRLARMVGSDMTDATEEQWTRLAAAFAERQMRLVQDAFELAAGAADITPSATIIAAGAGRGSIGELARRAGRPVRDIAEIFPAGNDAIQRLAAACAPASAVALISE